MRKVLSHPNAPNWSFFCEPELIAFSYNQESNFLTLLDQNNRELFSIALSDAALYPRGILSIETDAIAGIVVRPINAPIRLNSNHTIRIQVMHSEIQISYLK